MSPENSTKKSAQIDGAIALANRVSSCRTVGFTAADRIDPFWDGLWEQGSSASWLSRDLATRMARSGRGRIPGHLSISATTLRDSLRSAARSQPRLNAMSVIDSWRTVTGEQLAAITGDTASAGARSRTMSELFAAGVADQGTLLASGMSSTGNDRSTLLHRPSRTENFEKEIAPRLTYPEWVSITAGHPWASGGQYDRHNILAVELALRVAEFCEVGGVVGEKLSTWDMLAYTGAGQAAPPVGMQRAADATLIRTDGARIAVEITASMTGALQKKIRAWAELLNKTRTNDTALAAVVFVVATPPGKKVNRGEAISRVRTIVQNAARDYSGIAGDRTQSRMYVVSWEEWFPAARHASPGFFSLEAWRPSGNPFVNLWAKASLLDIFDTAFEPRYPEDALAVLDNLTGVRSVPRWLRTGDAPELWPLAIKALGFTGIPVLASEDPERERAVLGAARGAAANVLVPRRLRFGGPDADLPRR